MIHYPMRPRRRLDFSDSLDVGGLVAPTHFISVAGVLFPIAPYGLTSLYSLRSVRQTFYGSGAPSAANALCADYPSFHGENAAPAEAMYMVDGS